MKLNAAFLRVLTHFTQEQNQISTTNYQNILNAITVSVTLSYKYKGNISTAKMILNLIHSQSEFRCSIPNHLEVASKPVITWGNL